MSDAGGTLPDLLRRAAAARPQHIAVAVAGGESLTYSEWERRSDALAGTLRGTVDPGDRVALRFDVARWTDYATAYLAVHKAAGVAAPLDAALGAIEVRRLLRDCEASAVVAPPDLAPGGLSVPVFDAAASAGRGCDRTRSAPVAPSSLAEILYTSRPLSAPRPVARSHAALLAGPPLGGDPAAAATPLLHAFQVGTLAGQAALVACLRSTAVRSVALPAFDPERLCALLEAEPASACGLHPAAARVLLDSGAPARHDLSRVGRLILASGRVAPKLLLRLVAAFPRAVLLLADVLGHPRGGPVYFAHDRRRPGALGRPVGGGAVWIAGEGGQPVAPGELGGVRVAAAEETGRVGGSDGAAGDRLGYVDGEGFLYGIGGAHEVVRRRGMPVLAVEVESTLREHPAVVDAAVVERPGLTLLAAVVLDHPVGGAELADLVRSRLGEDKTPDAVVPVDGLLRDRTGVLLRGRLDRLLGDVPEPATIRPASSPVREIVAAVWARVLRREDVEPHEDFFELGGDASAAATVLGLLEDACAVHVSLPDFLAAPTVTGLVSAVTRLAARDGAALPAAPVAFSQEGMLWHELFAPGCQNLPGLARRYHGPLDAASLGRALDEIVRRHAALRTGFELRDGRPVQVVRPHRPRELAVAGLTHLAPDEREAEIERAVTDAGRRPFDLLVDPLFESTLLRVAEDDHVLVIRTHHSVFDDWSVGVFRRELATLYAAYSSGDPSPLPELPLQFADFSRRQRAALAGRAGTRELSFWRRELAGAPFATQLAVGDPEAPAGSPQAAAAPVSLTLEAELAERLRALARRERATVFMTVLAAFGVLVAGHTGQDDLVLATVVANRNRSELEGLIGCFTKKVPLRLRLGGDPTFAEVLARTRGALLGALSHQDLPFETVVQDVLGPGAAAHGLVPNLAVMFQGVTPRRELVLGDGLETVGLETANRATRAHFAADGERSGGEVPPLPWGAGLYAGTFVIMSLDESEGGLSCIARGAFHEPAVRELMESFRTLLAAVAADPARRVSELALPDRGAGAEVDLGGLRVEPARIRAALAACPGVDDVEVVLRRGQGGEPRLVAHVVPDGRPPTLSRLRSFLWTRLPGYAWPSALVLVDRLPAEEGEETASAEDGQGQSAVAALWAEVVGAEDVAPEDNYWQEFSFLEALARARDQGMAVPGDVVTRNRTIGTLAIALEAVRRSRAPGVPGPAVRREPRHCPPG